MAMFQKEHLCHQRNLSLQVGQTTVVLSEISSTWCSCRLPVIHLMLHGWLWFRALPGWPVCIVFKQADQVGITECAIPYASYFAITPQQLEILSQHFQVLVGSKFGQSCTRGYWNIESDGIVCDSQAIITMDQVFHHTNLHNYVRTSQICSALPARHDWR